MTQLVDTVNLLFQQWQWIHEPNVHHGGNENYLWFQHHGVLISGHVATALMSISFFIISN